MRHTFESHSSVPNFLFTCGISGCTQTLRTYSRITTHIRRRHPCCNFRDLEVVTTADTSTQEGSGDELRDEDLGPESEFVSSDSGAQLLDDEDHSLTAQRSAALLLLNLKERHRLTQSAINFSVGQVKQMVAHILEDVKISVKNKVGDVDIEDCFNADPFWGLETEALQSKFYREHFDLVVSSIIRQMLHVRLMMFIYLYWQEPVTIELGSELVTVCTGNKRRLSDKKRTFQYVPLLEGLQLLLNNREIFDEVGPKIIRS